jgi:DNA-binding GntR family transcriptional regulator
MWRGACFLDVGEIGYMDCCVIEPTFGIRAEGGKENMLDSNISRAEHVYSVLREGIRNGKLKSGQRLREAELATQLNVSRTPIREAIRRLAADGLIEVAPPRGMIIVELDRQRVRELYFLREMLEGAAARLAAQLAMPSEIEELRQLHAAGTEAKDPEAAATINRLFHKTIHDAGRNRYVARSLEDLSDSLALLPGTTFEAKGRQEGAAKEHGDILEAIANKDPDLAEDRARHHIRMAGATRIRMMFGI